MTEKGPLNTPYMCALHNSLSCLLKDQYPLWLRALTHRTMSVCSLWFSQLVNTQRQLPQAEEACSRVVFSAALSALGLLFAFSAGSFLLCRLHLAAFPRSPGRPGVTHTADKAQKHLLGPFLRTNCSPQQLLPKCFHLHPVLSHCQTSPAHITDAQIWGPSLLCARCQLATSVWGVVLLLFLILVLILMKYVDAVNDKTTSGIHEQEEMGRAQIIPPKVKKQSVLSSVLVKSWEDAFQFLNRLDTVSTFNNLKNLTLLVCAGYFSVLIIHSDLDHRIFNCIQDLFACIFTWGVGGGKWGSSGYSLIQRNLVEYAWYLTLRNLRAEAKPNTWQSSIPMVTTLNHG